MPRNYIEISERDRDFKNKVLPTSKQTKHLTHDNLISNLLIIAHISYCVFPI